MMQDVIVAKLHKSYCKQLGVRNTFIFNLLREPFYQRKTNATGDNSRNITIQTAIEGYIMMREYTHNTDAKQSHNKVTRNKIIIIKILFIQFYE